MQVYTFGSERLVKVNIPNRKSGDTGCREIKYCRKCLMPTSRPRISFDDMGICNACRHAERKQENIDWDERKNKFLEILDRYRSRDGSWDCVVPWSGGKDSSSIAYKLKFEFGMNPLLVTFSPMMPTDVGGHNREAMIRAGFDHVFFRPDQKVHRRLAKRFFIERGNQKVAWDAGINTIPVRTAVQHRIILIFYAEHGESEYGGKVINKYSEIFRDFTEVIEHQIGDDPLNWMDDEITVKELQPYIYPDFSDIRQLGVTAYYFAYFNKWSMFDNYQYLKDKIDFRTHPKGRTTGTFTKFDSLDDKMDPLYYYMQFIKFGFGRAVRDASRLIQNGHITREEGLKLATLYDSEFPEEYFDEVLEYLDLTKREFFEIVDRHRNPEIWKRTNGSWELRYPLSGASE
jgi:N-acetyl sugar amidotransferase